MQGYPHTTPTTRELLAYLATYLRSGRVMVVLTFRSDELDRLHPLRRLLGELAKRESLSYVRVEKGDDLVVWRRAA